MSVLSQVNALCEAIRPRVTVPVVLGRPDTAVPGLYVWPWRVEVNADWSNRLPRPPVGEAASSVNQPIFNTHVLILPIPVLSAEGLSSIEAAQLALYDHPLLTVNGAHSRIVPTATLSVGKLSALFIAAQLPLSVGAAFVLSGQSPAVA